MERGISVRHALKIILHRQVNHGADPPPELGAASVKFNASPTVRKYRRWRSIRHDGSSRRFFCATSRRRHRMVLGPLWSRLALPTERIMINGLFVFLLRDYLQAIQPDLMTFVQSVGIKLPKSNCSWSFRYLFSYDLTTIRSRD